MSTRKYNDLFPEEWYTLNPDIEDKMDELLSKPRKRRAYVPRGYLEGEKKVCYPVPGIITGLIRLLVDFRIHTSRSLRETQECLMQLERDNGIDDPNVISLGGVTQLFDRLERDLGISTKVTSQDRIKKRRLERLAEARAEGKNRPYAHSSKTKAKLDKQKRLTQTNKKLQEIEKERKRLQRQAARNARQLKLAHDPTKYVESKEDSSKLKYETVEAPAIINPDESLIDTYMLGLQTGWAESKLSSIYEEIMDKKATFDKRKVLFLPTPRQYLFLSAPEDIVLYGGAAG